MYRSISNEIFHIHTRRCRHAGNESDREYIDKAFALGVKRVVFTDHCPFPGNLFRSRMDIDELDEYIDSLKRLRVEYEGKVEVIIGLETEFLPSFMSYYEELKGNSSLDLLVLGQHFYEGPNRLWSFHEPDKSREFEGLFDAMTEGMKTGLFDVVVHPDRAFRHCKIWNEDMQRKSKELIRTAKKKRIYLEKNLASMEWNNQYWEPFWTMVPKKCCLYGYDAHSLVEMEDRYNRHKIYKELAEKKGIRRQKGKKL